MRKGRGSSYWTPPSNITLFLSSSCRSARGLGTLLPKRPGAKSLTVLLTSCKGRIVISVCHLYTKLYERNPSFHPIQLREVLVSIFESCLSARGASPYSHYGSKPKIPTSKFDSVITKPTGTNDDVGGDPPSAVKGEGISTLRTPTRLTAEASHDALPLSSHLISTTSSSNESPGTGALYHKVTTTLPLTQEGRFPIFSIGDLSGAESLHDLLEPVSVYARVPVKAPVENQNLSDSIPEL
ncbi:hypothetical protein FNV43_RR08255 [Rhamnella rubrinervis]|uniref:Uncharacterized protein n=1 Tax=Rhamnella rubrinervis TaxID=2594499 RepID=A0A8K0HGF4_9ROSA|nr:hypothetical protein FNV43_RR08255 [Rhamnella rubrinervis]